jgi:hypothetical protein
MIKKTTKLLIISLLILSFLFIFSTAYALETGEDKCAKGDKDCIVSLKNPLGKEAADTDVNLVIANIIQVVLGIVGSVALLMFVYGGFTWMIASGNNERVEKGKNILIWATIGLIVIFASYAMVEFIIKAIVGTP